MKKNELLIMACFVLSKIAISQIPNNSIYIFGSPNLQFVNLTYNPNNSNIKAYPWIGGYVGLGYYQTLRKNFFLDLSFGYNLKSFRHNYEGILRSKVYTGKVETNLNMGYFKNLDENKSIVVHLGYGVDFFGTPDTLKFEYPDLNLKEYAIGTDRPNMYFEIGFGILHHKFLKLFYTGISFKKGFYKSHEQLFVKTTNGVSQTSQIVSFQDNLSINLKYNLKKNQKRIHPL